MEKNLIKIFISSFLVITFFSIFLNYFKGFIEVKIYKKNNVLLIGILSAPENFEHRLSIRKTWLQLLPEVSGISYFIIGNHLCNVPEIFRAEPNGCIEMPFLVHENATSKTEFCTMRLVDHPVKKFSRNFIGFGFFTRSQLLIIKLGILRDFLKVISCEVQVKIISAHDGRVLASATFSQAMLEKKTPSVVVKAITPVLLPKHFEAFVKLEGKDLNHFVFPKCSTYAWMTEPNVIIFLNLWTLNSKIPHPFTINSCTYALMTYTVPDIKEIKIIMKSRNERIKSLKKYNSEVRKKLQNESLIYKDIMFVDVTDVYANLSLKMLKFYKRIVNSEYFQFVLKTDDDSFIDLLRVEELLKNILDESIQLDHRTRLNENTDDVNYPSPLKFWWWSFFREYWKVQLSGKWRENQYKSASYPSFPCGGGYVLSKGIVEYIASNEYNFNYFQGEDVSIGIWLSPLPVTYFTDPKVFVKSSNSLQEKIITKFKGEHFWNTVQKNSSIFRSISDLCDWTCTNEKRSELPLCNRIQNTIDTMHETWKHYISLGFC